jgi:hypothetical protein
VEMTSALRERGTCAPMVQVKAVAEQSCFHHLPLPTPAAPTAATSPTSPDRHHGDTP